MREGRQERSTGRRGLGPRFPRPFDLELLNVPSPTFIELLVESIGPTDIGSYL